MSASRRWVLAVSVLVGVAIVASAGTFLVLSDTTPESPSLVLEPATDHGPEPFTDSMSLVEYDGLPLVAEPVVGETLQTLPEPANGVRVADGATPGLFGGSSSDAVCDVGTLTNVLTEDPRSALTEAFAEAAEVDPADLEAYLSALTPVLLTSDTLVTNHGFANDRLTSRQSVLQAGTAVLIDDRGEPRVRCSCGNPLKAPETTEVRSDVTTTGRAWSGYSTQRVLSVRPAAQRLDSFTLVDLETGATFEQAPGETTALWVAVAGEPADHVDPTAERRPERGTIHISDSGTDWEQTFDTDIPLSAVAHGDGRLVAVGATLPGEDDGGIIVASDNGRTWSDPVRTPTGILDVAYGDGTWVAVSLDRAYVSPDGAAWEEQPLSALELYTEYGDGAEGIAYGGGSFTITTRSCGASACYPFEVLTSANGRDWEVSPVDLGDVIRAPSIGYGDSFAVVGYEALPMRKGQSNADRDVAPTAATLHDHGVDPIAAASSAPFLRSLSATDGTWYAVGASEPVLGAARDIYASDDLSHWTKVASVDAALTDVVVIG